VYGVGVDNPGGGVKQRRGGDTSSCVNIENGRENVQSY